MMKADGYKDGVYHAHTMIDKAGVAAKVHGCVVIESALDKTTSSGETSLVVTSSASMCWELTM